MIETQTQVNTRAAIEELVREFGKIDQPMDVLRVGLATEDGKRIIKVHVSTPRLDLSMSYVSVQGIPIQFVIEGSDEKKYR